MKYNKFLQSFGYGNKIRNYPLNERYFQKTMTLNKDSNMTTFNKIFTKTIPSKTIKSKSISEAIKKIENLKKKYNKINYEKKINDKMIYNKILKLKNKYMNDDDNIISNTISNINRNNMNFQIESTDKISMINKSWNKKNLKIQTNNNMANNNIIKNEKKIKLQKTNEINYQINSESPFINKTEQNRVKTNLYQNYTDKNIKNIRDEFLYLDKKINLLLKEDDDNDNSNENENNVEELLFSNKRLKSVRPIKDRIILLTDVKNKIKKINKDYEEVDKTQNSEYSIDSQINLGFKHIKPIIKRENFIEEYFKDDEVKNDNETITKPLLIKSFPRPKLNVPNYPSFFRK
jgi:hypothetical protein